VGGSGTLRSKVMDQLSKCFTLSRVHFGQIILACITHSPETRDQGNHQQRGGLGHGITALVYQGLVSQGRSQWNFLVHLGSGWHEFFLQQVDTGNDTQALVLGQPISVNQSGDVFRDPY
jgi:hypothetical protein